MAALEERGDTRSLGLVVARRAGLRVGELGRLELNCLGENPDGTFSLRVPLGKLRSEREIPIDEHTATLIKKIRSQRGERPTTIDPTTGRPVALLICHRNGRVVSRTLFRKTLKDAAAEYGIQENLYPHRLRHTYATEMLRYGVSLPGIMRLLGHTTIKMTLRYVQITNADLGREYLRAIERAVQHYDQLAPPEIHKVLDCPSEPLAVIRAAFDQIAARVQTLRCELPDPEGRKNLQRFIERIRRAQKKLHELLE